MSTALAAGKIGNNVPSTGRVFVIAQAGAASTIVQALNSRGHGVVEAADIAGALAAAMEEPPDLLLIDESLVAELPDHLAWPTLLIGDGHALPEVPRSCLGRIPAAMPPETLEAVLSLAVDLREVRLRCGELEHLFEGVRDGSAMVGRSPAIRRLHGVLRRAADSDATVLLEGQPGTGKSLAARIVHCKSRRGHRQIEVLACDSADPEAMNAALTRASDTTLLMEDVDHLPAATQAVLVRHLKERPQHGGDA